MASIKILDIAEFDPQNLKRPHRRNIGNYDQDPSWGISDTYSFASESKKVKPKRFYSKENGEIEIPKHIVDLFGNEVYFSDEDLNSIIEKFGINTKIVYQIEESQIDSITFTPVFRYRLVIPYKNWIFISDKSFYDQKPNKRKDKNQEFRYLEDSLLPEVMVQPNRGNEFTPLELFIAISNNSKDDDIIH